MNTKVPALACHIHGWHARHNRGDRYRGNHGVGHRHSGHDGGHKRHSGR